MNLPNKLTLIRILIVPFFVASFYLPWGFTNYIAAGLFIIAAITDHLDGRIARSKNLITNFGKFMDPIADKILVLAAMVMLNTMGKLSPIITIIVLSREFMVSGMRLVMAKEGTVVAASIWGKMKTVTQLVGIVMVLLDNPIFCLWNIPMDQIVMWISTVLAVISGWDYIKAGLKYIEFK